MLKLLSLISLVVFFFAETNAQGQINLQKDLATLVGKWKVEADMKATPFNPGGKFTGVNVAEWGPGRNFVVIHSRGTDPNGAAGELDIIAYDRQLRVYTYTSFNSNGWSDRTTVGFFENGTWIWTNEATSGGKIIRSRNEVRLESPDRFTFVNKLSINGGDFETVSTGTGTRLK